MPVLQINTEAQDNLLSQVTCYKVAGPLIFSYSWRYCDLRGKNNKIILSLKFKYLFLRAIISKLWPDRRITWGVCKTAYAWVPSSEKRFNRFRVGLAIVLCLKLPDDYDQPLHRYTATPVVLCL